MRRNSKSNNAISFFSFQDIITSVSGIMIFVAMLLVLDVTTAAFTPPDLATMPLSRQQVKQSIEKVRQKLSQVEAKLNASLIKSSRLAARNTSEISDEIEELRRKLKHMKTINTIRTKDRKVKEQHLMDLRKKIRSLEREIHVLMVAKSKLEATLRKRVVFAIEGKSTSQKVVLIELSAGKIIVRDLQSDFTSRKVLKNSKYFWEKTFRETLKAFPSNAYDALILIKPSVFENAMETVEYVKGLGYRTGFEPIEEDRSTMQ